MYKVILNGGVNAPQVQWYYLFTFGISTLYGFRKAIYYYLFHTVVLVGYGLYTDQFSDTTAILSMCQYVAISTTLLALFYYYEKIFETTKLQETKIAHNKRLETIRGELLHEINNPLSVVLNISHILLKKEPTELNSKLNNNSLRIRSVMDNIRKLEKLDDIDSNKE